MEDAVGVRVSEPCIKCSWDPRSLISNQKEQGVHFDGLEIVSLLFTDDKVLLVPSSVIRQLAVMQFVATIKGAGEQRVKWPIRLGMSEA